MRKQVLVCGLLFTLGMVGSPSAQPDQDRVPMPPVIESPQEQIDKGSRIIYPASGPAESGPSAIRSTETLLTEIATWLSTNFELPVIHDHPRIEFVSAMRLAALRYKSLLPDRTGEISVDGPAMPASQLPDIVAVYHDKKKTIYLADTWTGATATELSILVHEMVHHLQNLGELKYECAAAREKPAYIAQEEWLKRYDLDLEHEFEIDKFTLFIKSSCMF